MDAWRKASDCLYRLGNLKAGAVTLESAAREVSVGKDDAAKTEAARLYAEAAGFLQEAGEVVRAADLKMRASKLCETFDQALAMRFIDECISIFDGDADKDVYAVDPLRRAMQAQLALGKHASAMRTMDRLWTVWTRLDQKHNLYKLVLSRVILLLAAADPIAAQREYESKLDVAGFAATQEAAATEDLLQAYSAFCMRPRCAATRRADAPTRRRLNPPAPPARSRHGLRGARGALQEAHDVWVPRAGNHQDCKGAVGGARGGRQPRGRVQGGRGGQRGRAL